MKLEDAKLTFLKMRNLQNWSDLNGVTKSFMKFLAAFLIGSYKKGLIYRIQLNVFE